MPSKKRNITSASPSSTAIAGALATWFTSAARDLPWRKRTKGKRDAYAALVSEAMLQQTQVSRVVEKYRVFMDKFPTVAALAAAESSDVTAAWAGLGYYRRARSLHLAAKLIVEKHDGRVPTSHADLLTLPGVGRYTAGAIASIVFNQPQPLVDGNVVRVLSRLAARPGAADDKATIEWAWEEATHLAQAAHKLNIVSECNEGLMELGATVCTPGASPACNTCPLRNQCRAFDQGLQAKIPAPKSAKAKSPLRIVLILLRDTKGRLLIEQRTGAGLWTGLWQPPCIEVTLRSLTREQRTQLTSQGGIITGVQLTFTGSVTRTLTHKDVTIDVYSAGIKTGTKLLTLAAFATQPQRTLNVRTVTREELQTLGISNAHAAAVDMALRAESSQDGMLFA